MSRRVRPGPGHDDRRRGPREDESEQGAALLDEIRAKEVAAE